VDEAHDLRSPGYEHGSTIIVLAPRGCAFAPGVRHGSLLHVGQPLLVKAPTS
jgi:hypothetical protein